MACAGFEDGLQIAPANLAGDAFEIVRLHDSPEVNKYPLQVIHTYDDRRSSENAR
jgi:hypothetical protein